MSRGPTLADSMAGKAARTKRRSDDPSDRSPLAAGLGWIARLAAIALAVGFPWFRGATGYRAQSVMAAILLLGLATWILEWLMWRTRRDERLTWPVVPVLLGVGLAAVQLAPLPASLAERLAGGHVAVIESYAAPAYDGDPSTAPPARLAVDVSACRHQLALLVLALGGLCLGGHAFRRDGHLALFFLAVALNGAAFALYGVLEKWGIANLPAVTSLDRGLPFATYVNRNNAAGYLLLTLAAAAAYAYWQLLSWPSGGRPPLLISREIPVWRRVEQHVGRFLAQLTVLKVTALLAAIVIVVGIAASLSRGAALALLVGGLLTCVAFGFSRRPTHGATLITLAAFAAIGLVAWLGIGQSLMERFDELGDRQALDDSQRWQNWVDTFPAVSDFAPLGSGLGSYHAVHRLYRTDREDAYFEFAENQYFQALVEGGWPALTLLIAAVVLVVWMGLFISAKGNSPRTLAVGVAALFAITASGTASIFDFGLSLPANMMLLALLVGATSQHAHALAGRLRQSHPLQQALPGWATPLLLVGLAAGTAWGALRLNHWAAMDEAAVPFPFRETYLTLPLDRCQQQLDTLERLVRREPTAWGLRRLAELRVHRYRLLTHRELLARDPLHPEQHWAASSLVEQREQFVRWERRNDRAAIAAAQQQPRVAENLLPAWKELVASRNLLPLQPELHLRLAELQPVLSRTDDDREHLRRALAAAPTNAANAFVAGWLHLQAARFDEAIDAWRHTIELNPREYYPRVIAHVHPATPDLWRLAPQRVAEQLIPDDPQLLLRLAREHLDAPRLQEARRASLERADRLMSQKPTASDPERVWLAARIKYDLGETAAAERLYVWLLKLEPENGPARYELVQLLIAAEREAEALEQLDRLRKNDSQAFQRYERLYDLLKRRVENQKKRP